MIRVMLVDDNALVRMGFSMLPADAQVEVVAEAGSGEQACQGYARAKPDVVVMDLLMPGMGGLEALRRLLAQDPKARVLVLSAHEDTAHPRRALRASARGYLTKRSAPDALMLRSARWRAASAMWMRKPLWLWLCSTASHPPPTP